MIFSLFFRFAFVEITESSVIVKPQTIVLQKESISQEQRMIIKEPDPFCPENFREKTGRKAEEQLAFYLKRKYHADKNFFVINDLRFPFLDSFVQIDHLIVSKYGLVIVESKSVTSKVRYNEKGEWFRLWDNHWVGMPNAVKQAERQGEALKELLNNNHTFLLDKYLFGRLQKTFAKMRIDHIVAVSDHGSICRQGEDIYVNNVCKAESVTDKIEEIFLACEKSAGLFSSDALPWDMNETELEKVVDFLLKNHIPREENKNTVPEEEKREKQEEKKSGNELEEQPEKEDKIHAYLWCPQCKGKISILWGNKYKSYYWHCQDCRKNFPINHSCPQCHGKLKIRKQGNEYYIHCESCQISALYFEDK